MDWARVLAYVTGTVDQELLARNECLAAENRILKAQLKGRLELSDAERATLGEIAHRLGRNALAEVATVGGPSEGVRRNVLHWPAARRDAGHCADQGSQSRARQGLIRHTETKPYRRNAPICERRRPAASRTNVNSKMAIPTSEHQCRSGPTQ